MQACGCGGRGAHSVPMRWPLLMSGAHMRKPKCSPIAVPASLRPRTGPSRTRAGTRRGDAQPGARPRRIWTERLGLPCTASAVAAALWRVAVRWQPPQRSAKPSFRPGLWHDAETPCSKTTKCTLPKAKRMERLHAVLAPRPQLPPRVAPPCALSSRGCRAGAGRRTARPPRCPPR